MTLRQSHGQQHRVIGKVFLSPYPASLSRPNTPTFSRLLCSKGQIHLQLPVGWGQGPKYELTLCFLFS